MKAALVIGGLLALPLFVATVYGVVRTQKVEGDPRQAAFVAGLVPDPPPSGLYRGLLPGREVAWKWKKFKPADNAGINLFANKEGVVEEKYPFRTYVGRGKKDKKVDVFKIDYDIKGNPYWLRRVLDEVVQVAPDRMLGKVHFRWWLGMTFTLAFFELQALPPAATTPLVKTDGETMPVPTTE